MSHQTLRMHPRTYTRFQGGWGARLDALSVFYVVDVFSWCNCICYKSAVPRNRTCFCNRQDGPSLTAVNVACIVCCLLLLSLSLCGAPTHTHNFQLSVSLSVSALSVCIYTSSSAYPSLYYYCINTSLLFITDQLVTPQTDYSTPL